MSVKVRIVLLVAVLGGVAVLVRALQSNGKPLAVTPPAWTTSTQCKDCHAEVYAEWQGSHHQISYLNPEVRRLSDDFRNKECQACHLPRPVFETGLAQRTLPRMTRPDQGVDCLTCHLGPEGQIFGAITSDRGCRPVRSEEFLSVKLCETCHNQHQTTDQWRASDYATRGIDCNDCHMAPLSRADGSAGRGHVYPGAHDLDTLRQAATFTLEVEGVTATVSLTNTGAGHNFPTEERHRAVDILLGFTGADGSEGPWELVHRFRQPYRDEPGENTQLPAGETYTATRAIPEGASAVRARLWYRLNPFATDEDEASTLLQEHEVKIP